MAGGEHFVGRQGELGLLGRRLAEARAGSGGVLVVSGPAGIGKTRLVQEFLAGVDDTPAGWGAAVEDAGMPALWPWTRALRGWSAARAAMATLVAGDAQRAYGSADDTAASTFAADTMVVDALEQHARADGGLIVVLDDLHWADRATLRLLERVATEARRIPLLVIGTCRDTIDVRRPGATEELALGPLNPGDARTVLSGAVDRADPTAVRRAAEISGGSPLYLRTLGRVAAELLRGQGSWDDAIGAAPEFRNLVGTAMRAVGPDVTAAVEALSVLGSEADMELVASIIGVDGAATAIERLLPAVPAGLVEMSPGRLENLATSADDRPASFTPAAGPGVRFAHALVRDAAYACLLPNRRAQLHRRVAELLEPLATGRDERAGAVARHWSRAGEPGLALAWAIRAANSARAAAAYDEAGSYLELALDAIDRIGARGVDADRAELLLDLGRMQYLAGNIAASLRTCRNAAEEGERTRRADVVARAAITVQGIGGLDVNAAIAEFCQRALAMFDATSAADLRATLEAQLACALTELSAFDEAEHWSRRALVDAEASGDPNAELDAIRARVMLTWRPTEDEEVYALGQRAIDLAEPTRRPLARLWAHTWRSDVAFRRSDMAAARLEVLEMQRLADRTGLPLVRWHLLRRQASLAALTGNFDGCRRLGRLAMELAESWQDASVRYTHLAQTVCLALLRGDPADIDPQWTQLASDIDEQPPVARAVIAAALLVVGRETEARALYEPLIPILAAARAPQDAAIVAYLPHLARAFGDAASCLTLRDWMTGAYGGSRAIGSGTIFYYGSVARMLGQLELGAGEPAPAIAHFEDGLAVDGALGARPYVAEGRLGIAQGLYATGDVARGIEHGRAAAAEARRLDMPGLLREADAFLAAAAESVKAADPLTNREREVLALVARALSNREVANALVLSERTVESHVRSILAKAGLTSRTELVRWYLERPR